MHNKCFVAKPRSEPDLRHVGSFVDKILDTMEDSSTGGGDTTVNTALRNRLTYGNEQRKNIKVTLLSVEVVSPHQQQQQQQQQQKQLQQCDGDEIRGGGGGSGQGGGGGEGEEGGGDGGEGGEGDEGRGRR